MSSSVEDTQLLSQDYREGDSGSGYNTLQSGKDESKDAANPPEGKGGRNSKGKQGQRQNRFDTIRIFTIVSRSLKNFIFVSISEETLKLTL